MNVKRFVSAFLLLFAYSIICFAQNPPIDDGFVPALSQNSTSLAYSQVVQPDGKIIYAGNFKVANGRVRYGVVRMNTDGTIDTTFNCQVCGTFAVHNALVQPDGKILVAGRTNYNYLQLDVMVRLNPDGSQDNSFQYATNSNGAYTLNVKGILPNGKIIVLLRRQPNPSTDSVIRLNPNGSVDTSFNAFTVTLGADISVDVKVFPDGRVFVFGNNQYGALALLNDDGSKNTSFVSPTLSSSFNRTYITDVALQTDGKIVFTGLFQAVNGVSKINAARLNADQTLDATFTQPLPNALYGQIIPVSNNKFLVKGDTGVASQNILRMNNDGSYDNTFTPPAVAVTPIAIDSAERIYTGTYRYNADGTTDTSYSVSIELAGVASTVGRQADGKILIGGLFDKANGAVRKYVARVNADGSIDNSFNTGTSFNFSVIDFGFQTDNKILVVGNFTHDGINKSIVRLNSDGSLDGTFSANTNSTPGMGGSIYDVEVSADGKILIGGEFQSVNGQSRSRLARLNSDGSLDASFTGQLTGTSVKTIVVQPDGKIMIAGNFLAVNGISRSNLARLNSDGSLDASFNATVGALEKLVVQPDGNYLAASNTQIYRVNPDGSADGSFTSPTLNSNPFIMSLAVLNNGSIIMGGSFSSVNGISRQNIVKLSSNGTVDETAFLKGANSSVTRLLKLPDGNLIASGGYSLIEDKPRTGVSKILFSSPIGRTPFDFDGDGRTDIVAYRPSNSVWHQLLGTNYQYSSIGFGTGEDLVTPADFDGDGKTDIGIFRPSTGAWWYASSAQNGAYRAVGWGQSGDIPLPSDADGDGKDDYVVYRPTNSTWYRLTSSGQATSFAFGVSGDKPVIGDFDGDGKSDYAVFRPSTGVWWFTYSSQSNQTRAFQFGSAEDIPVPADYDGDGRTDFAVFRPSNGGWYIWNSGNGSVTSVPFGLGSDKPVAGDYDGDGRADIAVYRPSNGSWYILRSSAGFAGIQFGASTDIPIPNAFQR